MTASGQTTRRRAALLAGILLLAAGVVPLLLAPAPARPLIPTPDDGLLARLFPGVPATWLVLRLIALAAGALAVAWATAPTQQAPRPRPPAPLSSLPSWLVAFAATCAALALLAPWLPRALQLALLPMMVAVPATLAAIQTRAWQALARHRSAAAAAGCIIVLSCAAHEMLASRSLMAMQAPDGDESYRCIQQAAQPRFNLLTDGCWAGTTTMAGTLLGYGIVGTDAVPATLAIIRRTALVSYAVTAALLAFCAFRLSGAGAACIAAAAFLWSPMLLSVVQMPTLGNAVIVAAALAAVVSLQRSGSAAAAMVAVVLAGAMLAIPNMIVLAVLVLAMVARETMVRDAPPQPGAMRRMAAAAALFLVAAAAPGIGAIREMPQIARTYSSGAVSWAGLEALLQEQIPGRGRASFQSHDAPRSDLVIGTALAVVATPRAAIRHQGDVATEPVAAALALTALACAATRAGAAARSMTLVLAAIMLPGILSNYDRPHLMRIWTLLQPLALLSALGWQRIEQSLAPRRRAAAAAIATGVVAASGGTLFYIVNPTILARTASQIALEALGKSDRPVWTTMEPTVFSHQLSPSPLHTAAASQVAERLAADARALAVWSPADEDDHGVSALLCGRRPDLEIFVLHDPARLSSAFAAAAPSAWQPRLEPQRVERGSCGTILPTENARARQALAAAAELAAQGRREQSFELVEDTARRTFAQPALYATLARELARSGKSARLPHARYWADRACTVGGRSDPEICALAASLAAARTR